MTVRTDFTEVPPPLHRQAITWRVLVLTQVAVIALILLSLLVVLLNGAFGSLFVQSGS